MNCRREIVAIGVILTAAAAGCGDNVPPPPPPTTATYGHVEVQIQVTPADVTSIHVVVTGLDFGSKGTDMVQQPDKSWLGPLLDVPPGGGRTVTAEAFDVSNKKIFEGTAPNVTVFAGKLTSVTLTLKPTGDGIGVGVNTPPHFITLTHPDSILSDETALLFAAAADPDSNTQLTYTWSVLQGGGSLSDEEIANQTPGDMVSTVYTPAPGFTGFAVIEVSAFDGTALTSTTFPIAVGAGVVPAIGFDVLPDLTIESIERQALMPGDTSDIQYTLTNPVQPWTPATMHVQANWSDSCGGSFSTISEDLDINKGATTNRTVTYTAPSSQPDGVTRCRLTLELVDPATVQMTSTINVWIEPPMVMFVSSVAVFGDMFDGHWEAADAFCQGLADGAEAEVPAGIYHALLSFTEISAKDRLIDAPYVQIDGTPIARNKADLFSQDLLSSISINEKDTVADVSAVFTGTDENGLRGTHCLNWTSRDGGDTATVGLDDTASAPNWVNDGTSPCSAQLPIYCVQQPDNQPR